MSGFEMSGFTPQRQQETQQQQQKQQQGRRSPWILVSLMTLLIACDEPTATNNVTSSEDRNTAVATNCPTSDYAAMKFSPNEAEYVSGIFDFIPSETSLNIDTVTFQTPNHDLVFCRADQSWAIQLPSNAPEAELDATSFDELADPPPSTIEANNQTFTYRVNLDPNPFPDFTSEPQRVIFEIFPDETAEPFVLELYTLNQLRDSGLGYDLGVPTIANVVQVENTLFFVVNSEQGEGFNGLTTIVRYDIVGNNLEKVQPINLIGEQITDMEMTQTEDTVIFWLGTKYSGEGAGWIPAKGLVTYSFTMDDWQNGKTAAYSIHDSPLVGAIPSDLTLDNDNLWVATGSGICQFPWQKVKNWDAWECWEFTLMAEVPTAGLPLYGSLLGNTPQSMVTPTEESNVVEVYWWSSTEPLEFDEESQRKGRYEVSYATGLEVTVPEGGYAFEQITSSQPKLPWEIDVFWPGWDWHWAGDRFERSFDEVGFNFLSFGSVGISSNGYTGAGIQDVNVMRGNFELIELTSLGTTVRHFSGWVEDSQLEPKFEVIPSRKVQGTTPNPVKAIAPTLRN